MTAPKTLSAYRHMRKHAGYIVGQNARGALELARAETLLQHACDEGLATVAWHDDNEPYEHGCMTADEVAARFESNEWTGPYGCVVTVGDATASLWGIVLNQWGTNDPYARVVVAELASELADELRQAVGDAADAREGIAFP